MYGLDTPESVSVKDLEIFGKNSKDALNALVNGKNVTVQLGGSTYDRNVGLVKLADGTDISLTMLRNDTPPRSQSAKRYLGRFPFTTRQPVSV